eukprot:238710_1
MSIFCILCRISRHWKVKKSSILSLKQRCCCSSVPTTFLYEKCIFLNHYRNIMVQNDKRWLKNKAWIDSKRSRWVDIIALEAYVSGADGLLSKEETDAMTNHKILFGVDTSQIDEGLKKGELMINNACNDPNILQNFALNEWKDLSSNPYVPIEINLIISCIYFASVDGLHPKELEAANQIALTFGLKQEKFDKVMKALKKEEELFEDFSELFRE